VDNFERMCDNANGHELLSVITTLHHQAASPENQDKKVLSQMNVMPLYSFNNA